MAYAIPLSFSAASTELNTLTSQEANFTFTSDELTQALTLAWMDTYVVYEIWDSSTSFQVGTWSYAVPSTISAVSDIYYIRTESGGNPGDDYPERISPDLYEIVAGNIQFLEWTQTWIDDTYTLYVRGRGKLQVTDSLPTQNLANYVLNLAAQNLLQALLLKKTFVFLTNDTSIADIVNALKLFTANVLRYKQALPRVFESS